MRSISHYSQPLSSHVIYKYCCVSLRKSLYLSGSQIPYQFNKDKIFGPLNWLQEARTNIVSESLGKGVAGGQGSGICIFLNLPR